MFFRKYWLSLLFCITILALCLVNVAPMMPKVAMSNFDKLAHLLMFLGLSGVVFFDNTDYLKRQIMLRRILLGSVFFPIVFSGSIEIMQEYLVPHRSGDWWDFVYDIIGATLGLTICLMINQKLKKAKS